MKLNDGMLMYRTLIRHRSGCSNCHHEMAYCLSHTSELDEAVIHARKSTRLNRVSSSHSWPLLYSLTLLLKERDAVERRRLGPAEQGRQVC